jgi:hypothetical protein
MANLTPVLMYQGGDAAANVYTVSNTVGNYSIIKFINICNTTNTTHTCSLHLLRDGASPAANNKIISNAAVLSNNVLYFSTSIVIPANSNIYISQSSTGLTFNISGVQYA